MTDLAATFRKPFSEQVAAFRMRLANLVPTVRWDDISHGQHDRAFMVAGALKADLLADLAGAVDKAIAQGTTLEQFQRDFRAIVEKNGWHGWTGEGTAKGEAWRTRVIYRTNLATSYAAGRRAQLIEGNFKYWVYRHGGSLEPRLQHLAWDGIALPPDHPFWAMHAPPNGWGCSCRIFGARTDAGIRRVGGVPGKQLADGWDMIDPRTGTQVGIDKGWGYAPGATTAEDVNTMAAKIVHWPYELAKAFMSELPPDRADAMTLAFRRLPSTADELRRFARRAVEPSAPSTDNRLAAIDPPRTLGLLTTSQANEVQRLAGIEATGFDFMLDQAAVGHVFKRHSNPKIELSRGQRAITDADFGMLTAVLDHPDEVTTEMQPRVGPVIIYRKVIGAERYVAMFEMRTARKRLALLTMWIEKLTGRPPPSTP